MDNASGNNSEIIADYFSAVLPRGDGLASESQCRGYAIPTRVLHHLVDFHSTQIVQRTSNLDRWLAIEVTSPCSLDRCDRSIYYRDRVQA